jgi:hypothetical protein
VHPDQLPQHMRADLISALVLPNTAVQASLRAGCVHLTLTALASREEAARLAAPGAAAAALARLPAELLAGGGRVVVQSGGSSAAMLTHPTNGGPALLLSLPLGDGGAAAPAPVALAAPAATTVSAAGGRFRLRCRQELLSGSSPLALHCRCSGRHAVVSLTAVGAPDPAVPECSDGSGSEDAEDDADVAATAAAAADPAALVDAEAWVPVAAPDDADLAAAPGGAWQQGWGLYEFEVSRGKPGWPSGLSPLLAGPPMHGACTAAVLVLRCLHCCCT